MELYIQKQKIFDGGINQSSYNYQIVDASKTWVDDQWVNYYVYIVSGTGAGQISKISFNFSGSLVFDALDITLDNTSIYEIVAFPFERVEMFQDEKVSVTSTIQNYSDIGNGLKII